MKFFSALVNILAGLSVALILLFLQDWFGSNDTISYIVWTVPLAAGLAFFGQDFLEFLGDWNRLLRIFIILLISYLISFGWVFGVYLILGPWINAFSIPVFHLWAVGSFFQLLCLDFFLPKRAVKKNPINITLRLLAFPLVAFVCAILIFAFFFFVSYISRPEPESFLIPDDFEGKFIVIYGEECGKNPIVEDGRRIMEIPSNGVLVVQSEFEAGIIDHKYYFVDNQGNRLEVKKHENYSDGTTNIPGVGLGGSGSMGGEMPDGSLSSESPLAIRFTDFYVYQDVVDGNNFEQERVSSSLVRELVERCRENK